MAPSAQNAKRRSVRLKSSTSTSVTSINDTPKSKPKPRPKRERHPAKVLAEVANEQSCGVLQTLLDGFLGPAPSRVSDKDEHSSRAWKVYDGPLLKGIPDRKAQVWSLFEQNMHDIYVEAADPYLTWNPVKKKNELFHRNSRFIVLESAGGVLPDSEVAAFCMFRFDAEENDQGGWDFVIYIYEVQVSESLRGSGVCRRIFTALEHVGAEYKAKFLMLTCFRCNTKALPVYKHLKFEEHTDTSETAFVFFKTIQQQ